MQQLSDVIKVNLPAQVGDLLRQHLAELETAKAERDRLKAERLELDGKLATSRADSAALRNERDALLAKVKKDEDLTKREVVLDVTAAKADAEKHKFALDKIEALARLAFSNPTLYKSCGGFSDERGVWHQGGSTTERTTKDGVA